MTVLYFGIYDPNYSRNKVIIDGLNRNGVKVLECQVPASSSFKFFKLALKYLKLRPNFDVMMVGFPGQEIMFLARCLTFKPIVFDAFTSHYEGYILDRKKYSQYGLHAWYYRFLDKYSCKLANLVLLDTFAHIDFFVKEFNLSPKIFKRVLIGASDQIFQPLPEADAPYSNPFQVLFFGSYIPLQGPDYIVHAAKILESEDVVFTMVGTGQKKKQAVKLAQDLGLKNVIFKDMMTPADLRQEISKTDVCLGIFGDTPKTLLVIPNKVYEAVAMAKPVVTADSPAVREVFDSEDMILVQTANPQAIAHAVMELKNNPDLRNKLGQNGHQKFLKHSTPGVIGAEVKKILETLYEQN